MPTALRKKSAERLYVLDDLRGLAALYVCLGHARYLLHEGISGYREHPGQYSLLQKAGVHLFGVFGWGHEAVLFFFVLSGFSIHLRQANAQAQLGLDARFNLAAYFWRRGKRLYPPLLLALAVTFAVDRSGMALGWPIYGGRTPHVMVNTTVPAAVHDWRTLLGNLAFLMGSSCVAVFGSDSPLWSLRYEAWFYLFYPAVWLMNRRSRWLSSGVLAALAIGIPLFGNIPLPDIVLQPLQCMAVWWMGALLAEAWCGGVKIPLQRIAWLAPCILLGVRWPGADASLIGGPYWSTACLGFGFTGILAIGLLLQKRLNQLPWLRPLHVLGDFSYTLYVLHMPLLIFIGGWLMSRTPSGRLPTNLLWIFPGAAVCAAIAWLAHFMVEKPFVGGGKKKAVNS